MKPGSKRLPGDTDRFKVLGRTPRNENLLELERRLSDRQNSLLAHRYFQLCRDGELDRVQLIEIVKQLYCFSVFFERLLTLRISRYSSNMDPRILKAARQHLREEIGHAELFQRCLLSNGVSQADMNAVLPRMFTKSLFGYLLATILHENEYVVNVALMQVMEGIGHGFFKATLEVMKSHGMFTTVMQQHSEEDGQHARIGLELADEFDRRTLDDCHRVIEDLYQLMGHVLDEWLALIKEQSDRAAETG
jgi:thiaminase